MSWRVRVLRDVTNRLRYGPNAPLWGQRIDVVTAECTRVFSGFRSQDSGRVVGGDWDLRTGPVEDHPIVARALRHWRDGLSWEDVGTYDYMAEQIAKKGASAGCKSMQDVVKRHQRLDELFDEVERTGKLLTAGERSRSTRERNGVYFHLDRHGKPIFGARGCHRLAIAIVLELTTVGGQVGVVHRSAIGLRRSPIVRRA